LLIIILRVVWPGFSQCAYHIKIPLWLRFVEDIMHAVKVRDIGEFGLIKSIQELVNRCVQTSEEATFPLLLGIGDDAAAWRTTEATELATTDTLVDGVHFRSDLISWEDLGWKAMAVNLSDIAAMGGSPIYALVTLGLSPETDVEDVHALYEGMISACLQYHCRIAGGDMVQSPVTFITVAMTGVAGESVLTRHESKPGELIAVTGPLGCAAGGLQALLQDTALELEQSRHLYKAHNRPIPRLDACQVLVSCGVNAAMDISDGLTDDLSKMCVSSGVGAIIHAHHVPIDSLLKAAFPQTYLQLALNGGEDYELLFTGNEEVILNVIAELGLHDAIIGRIVAEHPGEVQVLDESGVEIQLNQHGWDHFK
jgi:thiamine-monophosphate kinase